MLKPRRLIKDAVAGRAEALQQIDQWIEAVLQNRTWGCVEPLELLVQEVRQALLARLQQRQFQVPDDLPLYVYSFTEQACLEHLRRQYRPPDADSLRQELELGLAHPDPGRTRQQVDHRRLFFQIFHALPDACRHLWRLIFLQDQSYPEIAERLHLDERQARLEFQRCKQQAIDLLRQLTFVPPHEPGTVDADAGSSRRKPGWLTNEHPALEPNRTVRACRGISEWLPSYVQGRFASDTRARIARHVAGCVACALEVADLRWFAEAIKRYGPVLLEDHPAADTLVAYARNPASIEPHTRYCVTRHLALCHTCRLEQTALRRVNESLGVAQHDQPLAESSATTPSIEGTAWRPGSAPFSSTWQRWRLWAVAGAALITVVALFMFFKVSLFPGQPDRVASQLVTLRTHYPSGEIAVPPQSFRWSIVPGAEAYRVGLYNRQHRILWRSHRTTTNSVPLPPNVAKRLIPDQPYFWQVIVQLDTGRATRSPLFEFTIRPFLQSAPR